MRRFLRLLAPSAGSSGLLQLNIVIGNVIARGQISTVCCRVVGEHKLESIEIPASIRSRLENARQP